MSKKLNKTEMPLSFGAFKPVGYVVLGFSTAQMAEEATTNLLTGGWGDDELITYSATEVIDAVNQALPHVGILASLGSEIDQMKLHAKLSSQGVHWLLVYAPSEEESTRVMRVAQRYDLRLAQKYHRLVVEDLI